MRSRRRSLSPHRDRSLFRTHRAPYLQAHRHPENLARVGGDLQVPFVDAIGLEMLPCGVQLLRGGGYGASELTVFSPAASKGNALLDLARARGIAVQQTFAIGDGVNDISMLRAAGMSVAMAHADRRTRAAARAVAAAGEDPASVIARYVLVGHPQLIRDMV